MTAQDLSVSLEYSPRVNFAFHQNGIPCLRRLEIRNSNGEAIENLRCVLTVEPEIAEPLVREIVRIEAESSYVELDLPLRLRFAELSAHSERVRGELRVQLETPNPDGAGSRVGGTTEFPVCPDTKPSLVAHA